MTKHEQKLKDVGVGLGLEFRLNFAEGLHLNNSEHVDFVRAWFSDEKLQARDIITILVAAQEQSQYFHPVELADVLAEKYRKITEAEFKLSGSILYHRAKGNTTWKQLNGLVDQATLDYAVESLLDEQDEEVIFPDLA